jgi:hypothetical protein
MVMLATTFRHYLLHCVGFCRATAAVDRGRLVPDPRRSREP